MPAERFYINADLTGTLTLEGTEHHHLAHVMRIRVGEEVELVNGRGSLAAARVETLARHEAQLAVLSTHTTPLPPPHLTLAIPLMRPAKLELVIEKCTELGADRFYLYAAHYSEKGELSANGFERLCHIAISAMKQCGRLRLPEILLKKWDDVLEKNLYFGDPESELCPETSAEPCVFATGPEKGFSAKELQSLKDRGTGVRLHANILRAETAPMVAAIYYHR